MRVTNRAGRTTADEVEVLLAQVQYVDISTADEDRTSLPALSNQPLPWSSSLPTTTRLSVPPGVERHVDLLRVFHTSAAEGNLKMELLIHPKPADGRQVLPSGTYAIWLAVTARNADRLMYEVFVAFDGCWAEDIWKHLLVSEPMKWRPQGSIRR